jgi:CubicO group peptidase (beta-lactamase class C family)
MPRVRRSAYLAAVVGLALSGAAIWATRPLVTPLPHPVGVPLTPGPPLSTDHKVRTALAGMTGIDALMVVDGGALRLDWGATAQPMHVASVRKSVIAVLFGIALARGQVDLHATLADLGIDESRTPLTAEERRATLGDLLASRSGIYLPAGGESADTAALRPPRGSAPPGTRFWYNNWDFNVLGTILERQTGRPLGETLQDWLATPLGMQDFAPHHVVWTDDSASDYPTWRIWMSARDLARIGVLVAQDGAWEGRQIVPADWIATMLTPRSRATEGDDAPLRFRDYGYLWWIDTPTGEVAAAGNGGQFLVVDPATDLVLVSLRQNGATPLGYVWTGWFGTPGRFDDLLTLRTLVRAGR